MEPDAHTGSGNSQNRKDPAREAVDREDAEISQNGRGEEPSRPTSAPEPPSWEELQWSLFGLGPDGKELPSKEKIPHEEILDGDLSEELSSMVGELDTNTRRALQEIDTYASASALAQERTALMGRAEDLTMDLRDMQEQIREMEAARVGLRLAFKKVYRQPEETFRVWQKLESGIDDGEGGGRGKASQILAASPERLGALRGNSVFGVSTPARSEAIRAAARAGGLARACQDAVRRATRLGVFGKDHASGRHSATKERYFDENGTRRYSGLNQKRKEIQAMKNEADVLSEKVQELTGGQPLSEQSRAVIERVRSLAPEQRQALRKVILGAGAQSIGDAEPNRETGRRATPGREAVASGNGIEKAPTMKRGATARSTGRRGQSSRKVTSTAATAKGVLKASLRHVAIHVAIRTIDRVDKEARGREMLEI